MIYHKRSKFFLILNLKRKIGGGAVFYDIKKYMENFRICDTHNDFLTELKVEQLVSYIDECKNIGVEIISASYWSSKKKRELIKNDLARRAAILRQNSNFLLHIEDLWWIESEYDLKFLQLQKPFSCSLTWNGKNTLAGGNGSKGGLTEKGKRVIEKMLENNIVVDLAHLNSQSFYEATKIVRDNLYCSHTGLRGVKKQKRNLTDGQIDVIVRSNGFVGIFFFDKCIKLHKNNNFTSCDIAKNIKYFVQRWGIGNIGIGSDFYGIENYPVDLQGYNDFKNLAHSLKEEGFNQYQIEKIFYQNFQDFLIRVGKPVSEVES